MNYNPSPKSIFAESSENLAAHRQLVQNPALRKSIEIALLEMTRRICNSAPPEMGACAAAHLRCLGAHDFIEVFYNLAETPVAEKPVDTNNLPGNVRNLRGNK